MSHACQRFWNLPCHTNWLQACGAFTFWISKCASHRSTVHFFNISTSKSALKLQHFAHFDLEMCIAPQRRALFHHLNFQKCSKKGMLLPFWRHFTPQRRTLCQDLNRCFSHFDFEICFPPQCVQFLISHLWLRARRFREPTFRPSGATVSRLSYLFAHLDLLSSSWSPLVAREAAALCVAGVALEDIHLHSAWQARHLWHWAGSSGSGPRWKHLHRLVVRDCTQSFTHITLHIQLF